MKSKIFPSLALALGLAAQTGQAAEIASGPPTGSRLAPVNSRARLEAAGEAGVISLHGARDLLNAYDVIAQTRIEHQARQIRAGEAPDNFMQPNELSDFERSHLRDAFVVVKTMQAALMQGRRLLG